MECMACWLTAGVATAEGPELNSCGPHSLSTVITTTNRSGQKNSHSFRANSSEFSRRWFIALTLDRAPVSTSASQRRCFSALRMGRDFAKNS